MVRLNMTGALFAVAVIVGLTSRTLAQAGPDVAASIAGQDYITGQSIVRTASGAGPEVSVNGLGAHAYAGATSTGFAARLAAVASIIVSGPTYPVGAQARASSGSQDVLTVAVPGVVGQVGYFGIRYHVSGRLSQFGTFVGDFPQGQSSASWSVTAYASSAAGASVINPTRSGGIGGPFASSSSVDRDEIFVVSFIFGTPFTFGVNLAVQSSANVVLDGAPAASARGSAAFDNTFYWAGITDVRDAAGNVLNNATITAASGLDLTQPVPLPPAIPAPSSVAALALGGVLAARRRRR